MTGNKLKVLLVLPPTAERPAYAEPPLGLLCVGTALKNALYPTSIIDLYRNYMSPSDFLGIVKSGGYDVVAFGGITTCYEYVKEASKLIRKDLPAVHLVAGGVLSSAHEILLKNTPIDVICMGEGEITAVKIMDRLAQNSKRFDDINGVSFITPSGIVRTPPQKYIDDLDSLPVPDYGLIDMDIYAFDAMKDPFFSANPSSRSFYRKGMRCFNLKTARGCTNTCAFCYRHFVGYRQHSIEYVIRHIKYLQEKYNIHFLRFGDELFTKSKEWVMQFTDRLARENVRIRYIVHGVRTDNVDDELVGSLRGSGCIALFIGFESGSQRMLKVMRKNVTVEQNISAIGTILSGGLDVLAQTVIGMPEESDQTIDETIASLIKSGVSPEWVAINYAQAYPGTWLWQHAIKSNIIRDPEKYLIDIGRSDDLFINYTDSPDDKVKGWRWRIIRALALERARKAGGLINRLQTLSPKCYSLGNIYKKEGASAASQKVIAYVSSKMKAN